MIKENIKSRRSVRSFTGGDIKAEHMHAIQEYLSNPDNFSGVYGNDIKIQLKKIDGKKESKIGTYGIIKNPSYYAIGICKNNKENMIDCGYVFEQFILFLQGLGIGTCWLGGTFDRKKLSLDTEMASDEFIPIVVPFGYPSDTRSLMDKLIAKTAKSTSRIPFDQLFFKETFNNVIEDSTLRDTLEYVRVAPSASNKQPWRIVMSGQKAHFYLKRTNGVVENKISYDIQMLDIGIAIAHYCLVTNRFNFSKASPEVGALEDHVEYVLSVE